MNTLHKIVRRVLYGLLLAVFVIIPFRLKVGGVDAIVYLIWLSLAAWLLAGLPGLRAVFSDHRRWWLLTLTVFIGWAWLSVVWSRVPDVSLRAAQGLTLALLVTLITAACLQRIGLSTRHVHGALVVGMLLQSAVAIGQAHLQRPLGLSVLGETALAIGHPDASILTAGPNNEIWLRPYGLTAHPNILGGYLAVGLLATIGLYLSVKTFHWQVVLSVALAFGVWALGLTFSRAAWVGFAAGMVLLVGVLALRGIRGINRRRLLWMLGVIIFTIGLFTAAYWRLIDGRVDINGHNERHSLEQRSISDRRYYIGIALQAFAERPLTGIGAGTLLRYANDVVRTGPYADWMNGDYVHNVPLLILAELGVVGVILWLNSWVIGLLAGWSCRERLISDPAMLALLASICALLIIGLFDHYPYTTRQFMLVLWSFGGIILSHQ